MVTIQNDDEFVEALAAFVHERWSHWMAYQIECGTVMPDGALLLPRDRVGGWIRQMETPYADLSDEDKAKDRAVASAFVASLTKTPESAELERFDDDGGCVQ